MTALLVTVIVLTSLLCGTVGLLWLLAVTSDQPRSKLLLWFVAFLVLGPIALLLGLLEDVEETP